MWIVFSDEAFANCPFNWNDFPCFWAFQTNVNSQKMDSTSGQRPMLETAPIGFDAQISYRVHSMKRADVQSEDWSSQLSLSISLDLLFKNDIREAYILKAEKVAILANKKWRKKCVNLNKTKIATKVRKSWKWKELLTSCWIKASFLILYCLYCLHMDRNYNKLLKLSQFTQELPRHRGCAALMLHSQPRIWRKIQKLIGDISPASLAFRKYGSHFKTWIQKSRCGSW